MDNNYRNLIAQEFRSCVNGTIDRVTNNTPTYRPFHTALLSDEVIFWSAFERSFSTSFGQRVIEQITKLVALSNGAECADRQVETVINIDKAYEEAIHDHVQSLRSSHRGAVRSWESIVNEIRHVQPIGESKKLRIISDVWWRKNGIDNYISLKTVKPNIDQTVIAKTDCLHLTIAKPKCNAYFGLPYNPYGENREDYSFSPPMGIFDFRHDSIVLIGRDMWDTIGGPGCYDELLEIATQVGCETRETIRRFHN